MSDAQLNVDFKFNTQESKKQTAEIRKDVEAVNVAAEASNKPLIEREGILERLKRRMAELKAEADKTTSFVAIEKANTEIQLFEREINRLTKVGRQGFDDMGNAIPNFERPIGHVNRLKVAMQGYSNMVASSTNPEIISKYNRKLQESQIEVTRLTNVGKLGFDSMGNAIAKNTNLISKAWSGLTKLAYLLPGFGIAGLLALGIDPLMKLIDKTEIFKKKLSESQKEAKLLSDALAGDGYKKAIVSINELRINLDLAKKGMFDKTAVVDAYNETIGSVSGKVETLNSVEKGLADNAENYVKMTLYKAAANLSLTKAAEAALEAEEARMKSADDSLTFFQKVVDVLNRNSSAVTGPGGMPVDTRKVQEQAEKDKERMAAETRKKNEERAEKEVASNTKIAKKLMESAADVAKEMGGVLGLDISKQTKDEKEMDRAVSAAQSMQQKIYDLKAEYTRKSLEKDEEELQAVRDKFVKIAEEAERFNNNKKNKIKVSTAGLDEVRDQAITDLKYKQDTEKLKVSLIEQKKLYGDYEEYKISLGKDKADEKYKGLIDTEKSHLENLRAELAKIPESATGTQSERKDELEKQIREEESLQLKKFNDLLKANQSYQDKVKVAIEQFESNKKKLIDDGKSSEVEVLTTGHEENLLSLTENHVKQLDAYKKLYEGIELMSNAQAKTVIENAKDMLANTDMPEALYLKILALINETEKALGDRVYDRVGEIGAAFDEMANGVDGLNEGLSNSLRILGDMLHAVSTVGESVGDIKTGISNYGQTKTDAGGGVLGTIAGVAGIAGPIGQAVGAVANLAKGIVGVFKAAKESRIQAEKELAAFDAQKYNAEFEINAMYRERLRTQNELNKATLDGLKETHALLKTQQKEVADDQSKIFQALQREQFVAGKKTEKYGGFLGIGKKTRTVDIMGSLAGKSYEDIERLFISNQLTDRAKELFQQLEKIKKEGVDVDGLLAENTKEIWAKATGTTSESITDSIIKGFENGYRSAADFADDFKGLMNQATREVFKDFVQNKEMEAFYERYANMAKDGSLTEAQRGELKGLYDGMIGRINNKYEDLKSITGEDFLKDSESNQKGLTGRIGRSLTEDTGSQILGFERSRYDLAKQNLAVQKEKLAFHRRSYDNLVGSLKHQAAIEQNTANTVTELQNVVNRLDTIVTNTKQGMTSRDLAT